jgi:hypothetical protein
VRDKALAERRKALAVELRLGGMEYAEIARELGYSNKGTVWKVVQRALRDRTVERVDEYRETELARLDALQASCWDRAMAGDVPSANAVLKVMQHRARLLGLDRHEVPGSTPRCVVLSPDELAAWEATTS